MKKAPLKVFLSFLIFLLPLWACSQDFIKKPARLKSVQGEVIDFPSKEGKWVVVNFWASWCAPCREEIPALNRLHLHHRDIVVVGVNVEDAADKRLKKMIKELNIQYPVLANDPSTLLDLPDYPGLPTTFILTPEGKWLSPRYGAQTEKSLLTAIRK